MSVVVMLLMAFAGGFLGGFLGSIGAVWVWYVRSPEGEANVQAEAAQKISDWPK